MKLFGESLPVCSYLSTKLCKHITDYHPTGPSSILVLNLKTRPSDVSFCKGYFTFDHVYLFFYYANISIIRPSISLPLLYPCCLQFWLYLTLVIYIYIPSVLFSVSYRVTISSLTIGWRLLFAL